MTKREAKFQKRIDRLTREKHEMTQRAQKRNLHAVEDDFLCIAEAGLPLLECDEVEATCVDVVKQEFGQYDQTKLILIFNVYFPERYQCVRLNMYLTHYERPGMRSKMYKLIRTVVGEVKRKQRITKSMFVGRAYRCKLRTVDVDGVRYSVVDEVLEVLTGRTSG